MASEKLRNPYLLNAADLNYEDIHQWLSEDYKDIPVFAGAGVPIGMGTDTGPPARFQGYFEHMEMQMMVKLGFKLTLKSSLHFSEGVKLSSIFCPRKNERAVFLSSLWVSQS